MYLKDLIINTKNSFKNCNPNEDCQNENCPFYIIENECACLPTCNLDHFIENYKNISKENITIKNIRVPYDEICETLESTLKKGWNILHLEHTTINYYDLIMYKYLDKSSVDQ